MIARRRAALKNAINHLRAIHHELVDAHCPGSSDEVARLMQTLTRHLAELQVGVALTRLDAIRAKHERSGEPDEQQLAEWGRTS